MKHSSEEIINALKIIKETCEESISECTKCPLRHKGSYCGIHHVYPREWNVKNEVEPWRAFNG